MIHLQVQYINEHNEKMIIRKCDKGQFWFYHSDCNDDFELINNNCDGFKYILDITEQAVLINFLKSYKNKQNGK